MYQKVTVIHFSTQEKKVKRSHFILAYSPYYPFKHTFIYSCRSVCQELEKDSVMTRVDSILPSGKQLAWPNYHIRVPLWLPDFSITEKH